MKYIELIYCKLVWFITKTDLDWFSSKLKFEKWPNGYHCYRARQYLAMPLMILPVIILFSLAFFNVVIEPFSMLFIPFVMSFIIHWLICRHLIKQRRTTRIVFNKEYMQSKWGVVLTLLYMSPFILLFIFCIVGLIVLAQ